MTSSEIEFDPVLTWDLPYHPDLIVWSAQHISKGESTHVDVLPVESLALSAAQKCHRCLIVEGPKDTWYVRIVLSLFVANLLTLYSHLRPGQGGLADQK